MNPLAFLLIAVVVSVLGTIILWSRHRESDSPEASVEAFNAKMRALSDDPVVNDQHDDGERRP